MPHGKRIAELLVDIGAVKLSIDPPFTWTSGIKSPIYCDNRMIYSHPEARNFIVDALVTRIKSLHIDPDCIAGTATAAIGWAALVADRMDLPFVYVRAKAKEHGAKKRIEGDLKEGWDVVVVEDLISTGGSAISTVEAIRDEGGATCTDVVAIFTYEMLVANEKAQNANVKFHPVATLGILLDVALEQGRLGSKEIAKVSKFAENPQIWDESL
jgi:orotate phosphoribosyltransferase